MNFPSDQVCESLNLNSQSGSNPINPSQSGSNPITPSTSNVMSESNPMNGTSDTPSDSGSQLQQSNGVFLTFSATILIISFLLNIIF